MVATNFKENTNIQDTSAAKLADLRDLMAD